MAVLLPCWDSVVPEPAFYLPERSPATISPAVNGSCGGTFDCLSEATLGRQAQKNASTRKLIIRSAIRCFLEFGYLRTTTTEVAKRAGASRGAMRHHFSSKLEIVRAAVDYLHSMRS